MASMYGHNQTQPNRHIFDNVCSGLPILAIPAPSTLWGHMNSETKEETLRKENDALFSQNYPYASLQGNRGQRTSKAPPPLA
jgi:hypothetical protein